MRRKWRRSWARSKPERQPNRLVKSFQEIPSWKTMAKCLLPLVAAAGLMINSMGITYALPTEVVTKAGNVTVSQSGNTMTVNETSATGIVNSKTFVINSNETLNIYQPSSSASLLWKVLGNDPSAIYGHLNANGQLFLYNPQGTLFARGAQVNVGSLVATSLNITDSDYLAGNYKFSGSDSSGTVVNQGTITAADGGYVALLAPQVANDGVIVAQQGTVALGAGSAVTLDLAGDGLLNLAVDKSAVDASAANHNLIQADGGQVIMTASTASDLTRTAVNNSGVILARTANNVNGVIRLDGGTSGAVVNSGTLDASGQNPGATGGTVKVLGKEVTLTGAAKVDVSGDSGGGTALIGGNTQGKGSEANATTTTVADGATIKADAVTAGDGGKVVVWADGITNYYGTISAQGGRVSGNGGSAEVSGKQTLLYKGYADLRATNGTTGTLLLDPGEYTISTGATSGNVYNVTELGNQLNAANVTLATDGTGSGNITVAADLTNWTSGNTLTLKANNDIDVNATVTSTGGGNVVLRADSDADSSGTVNFGTGGKVVTGGAVSIYYNPSGTTTTTINGTSTSVKDYTTPTDYSSYVQNTSGGSGSLTAYMLVNNVNELQAISLNLNGTYALGGDIDAGATSTWNSGAGFVPISSFSGTLDGNGQAVSGLYINNTSDSNVGLFGSVTGKIRNLGLKNVNIAGSGTVGGLAGTASGSIINCYVSGQITGKSNNTGGLVGNLSGTISDSYSTGAVTGSSSSIGGLVGYSNGTINNSYSASAVTSGSNSSIGGLVGYNDSNGKITNSYSSGAVTNNGSGSSTGGLVGYNYGGAISGSYSVGAVTDSGGTYTGGLVGFNSGGTISDSYSANLLTSGASYVGGLVGSNDNGGAITGSYSSDAVTGGGTYTGGLAGYSSGTISNSYSTGAVTNTGSGSYVGGLVGNFGGTLDNSYSSGAVTDNNTGGGSIIGGLVGYNSAGKITNCYSSGAVTGNSTAGGNIIGGLVGVNDGGWDTAIINSSYSAGAVTADSANYIIGGLAGVNANDMSMAIIKNSYWNADKTPALSAASIIGGAVGSGDQDHISNVAGLSGSSLYSASSYSGFSIVDTSSPNYTFGSNTWVIVNGSTLPFLESEYSTTITNAHQLQLMALKPVASYTLAANIDMAGYNMTRSGDFLPIGTSSTAVFTGSLDGGGYVVSNLTITDSTSDAVGLFGYIGKGATVSNIGLYNVDIAGGTSSVYVGSLAGYNDGIVTNVYSTGTVSGNGTVGGLAGLNNGTIQTSYTTAQVVVNGSGGQAGGLVGENDNKIINAYSTGAVSGVAGSTIGGLVGTAGSGSIINSSGWDIGTSGQAVGVGSGSSSGVTGLTTDEMMDESYLESLGFDFDNTWYMVDGSTRPFLRSENVTTITNAHQLQLMGANLSANYTLASDIDLSELKAAAGMWGTAGFVPVGSSTALFTGTLKGAGHTISGLTVNNPTLAAVGLFGYIEGATISNISLNNAAITAGSGSYAGGLAGENAGGSITNVYISGTVTAAGGYAGGLVGINTGGIIDCSTSGTVTVTGPGTAGGVTGDNSGQILNCYNTGAVGISGDSSYAGGVAGTNAGSIVDSHNTGTVMASGADSYAGGVAGTNAGSIIGSYHIGTVSVSGTGSDAGGVAGTSSGSIDASYNAGTVTGSGDAEQLGGVAGENSGTITVSYNNTAGTVSVSGVNSIVGGVAGTNAGSIANDSYNAGTVAGNSSVEQVGGVAGINTGNITSSYNAGPVTGNGSQSTIGGVAGINTGSITSSYNAAAVAGNGSGSAIGGITGTNSGSIFCSYGSAAELVSSNADSNFVGGVAGINDGSILYSFNNGKVDTTAGAINNKVGGVVGFNAAAGSLTKPYNTGTVSVSGDNSAVGGVAGKNEGGITSANNSGAVTTTGATSPTGGLVGINSGTVTESFAVGNVSGYYNIGGLVGTNIDTGRITDCYYAIAAVIGSGGASKAGGVAGVNSGTITTSYNSGKITGGGVTGGLVGDGTGGTIEDSLWDSDKSGQQYGVGSNHTASGVTGLTTEQTGKAASYPSDWNFTDTWTLAATGPRLQWQDQTNLIITTLSIIDAAAASSIGNSLNAGTDVTLITSQSSANSGDIDVDSALSWASGKTLTLSAYRDVNVNANITSTGSGNVVLQADNGGTDTGTVNFGTNGRVVTNGAVSIYYNPAGTTGATINGAGTIVKDYTNPTDYSVYVKNMSGGAGNLTAYMLVNNVNELQAISLNVFGNYALGKDIDASVTRDWNNGAGFTPIGDGSFIWNPDNWYFNNFNGVLDGNGHVISGLYINKADGSNVGLFGYVGSGMVRNLGLENANITGAGWTGGLAGYSSGTISNCYVTGTVTGSGGSGVGGLVGQSTGLITDSYSTASVRAANVQCAGGLVGENDGQIADSYSTGPISTTGTAFTGGLAGYNSGGTIANSYSTGAVTSDVTVDWFAHAGTGGLVGYNTNGGTLENDYSTGKVAGKVTITGEYSDVGIGGLVGENYGGTINGSYGSGPVTGSVTITGNNSYAGTGGLAGYNSGSTIQNSYSTGMVTGNDSVSYVGGLVGYNVNGGMISGSYSAGKVTGGSYAGGFIGGTDNVDNIIASYFDIDSSGQQNGSGDGSSITGLTGLSASGSDPYSQSSYSNFDFDTTWYMIDGSTRPFLQWEYSTTITNAHQLQLMAKDLGAQYTLATNIDMTGYDMTKGGFLPVGSSGTPFIGSLDGKGYVISNLSITGSPTDTVGLFGYIGPSATVSNVGLYDANITGGSAVYVGSLAGFNDGTVTNVYSTGRVTGSGTVGGLVGFNDGIITTSYTTSQVTGSSSGDKVGGLVGENDNKILNAYSTGAVSGLAGGMIGGLVGYAGSGSTITDSAWDTETSGIGATQGVGNVTNASGVAALTTEKMMDESYLEGLGFDFDNTWYMIDGSTRPFLRSENVATITNAHQLQLMDANLSATYALGSDIDLSELSDVSGMWNTATGFAPVGSSNAAFTGSLGGNGHTISGLMVNNPALTAAGLFGYIKNATIADIILSNAAITAGSGSYAGSLVGENDGGTVINACLTGTATLSGSTIGGLIGLNTGNMFDCINSSTGTVTDASTVGGVAGVNDGTIISSYNVGTVTGGSVTEQVGGVVGINTGSITGSYNAGTVTGSGATEQIGGVAGTNTGSITGSYNAGTVTGSGASEQVGGVAGANTGSITNSYTKTDGLVSASGDGSLAGGVAGSNDATGTISSSYNAGTVTGSGATEQVGGVAGANAGTITGSYNANTSGVVSISGDHSYAGGVAGDNTGTITASYNAAGRYALNDTGYDSSNITVAAGAVSGTGTNERVGGVVGQNTGTVTDSYNAGTVSVSGNGSAVGGVAGVNTAAGAISDSYNAMVKTTAEFSAGTLSAAYTEGTVTSNAADSFVGGLVGENAGTVTNCYNWGPVTAIGVDNTTGGLVGWNESGGRINNSYSGPIMVTVSGDRSIAGGLVGQNDGGLAYTYAVTPLFVSGVGSTTGGLVGVNGPDGTINNSFWNTEIAGVNSGVGSGTTGGVTGVTTDQMMQSSTYAGWDLTNIWNVVDGYSFPYLSGQYSDYKWWNGMEYVFPALQFIFGTVQDGGAGKTVAIRLGGSNFSAKTISASGFYYALVPAGYASAYEQGGTVTALYVTNDANYKANAWYRNSVHGLADGNLIKDTLIDDAEGRYSSYFTSELTNPPSIPAADSLYTSSNGALSVNGNLVINFSGDSEDVFVIDSPVTATGDITVNASNLFIDYVFAKAKGYDFGGGKLTAGGNITVLANNGFFNDVGTGAFQLTGNGRWLVYSSDPLLTQSDMLYYFQRQYISSFLGNDLTIWKDVHQYYLSGHYREMVFDGRGELAGDFTQWNTVYGDAVPATGNGFVYTALDPAIRPLTPGQQQMATAIVDAHLYNAKGQAPVVPAAASSLMVTINGEGVATEPTETIRLTEEPSVQPDKSDQDGTGLKTDQGK